VLAAVLPVLWLAIFSAGPVHAQASSPGGPPGNAPSQGGATNGQGPNAGGNGQAGNQTTPGGDGTAGGGDAPTVKNTADGGMSGILVGVVAVLLVIGVVVGVATRHRRLVGAGAESAT